MSNETPGNGRTHRRAKMLVMALIVALIPVAFTAGYTSMFGLFDDSSDTSNTDAPTSDAPSTTVPDPITDPEQFPEPDVDVFADWINESDTLRNDLFPDYLQGGKISINGQVDDEAGRPDTRSYDCKVAAGIEASDTCIVRLYFNGRDWYLFVVIVNDVPRYIPDQVIPGY